MVSIVNARADVLRATAALAANCNAAKGLQEVVKTNLGPKGTLKMLVGGAGQIKITKDGCVLLHEMQIQHPTAAMIARAATAQDEITGDGTTSSVVLIGELLRQAERLIVEGIHPRIICRGFDRARTRCLELLEKFQVRVKTEPLPDRELLQSVARTSLRTKVHAALADSLTNEVVDAVCLISQENNVCKKEEQKEEKKKEIDLFMVEIIHMRHGLASETKLIKGLVMDHGARHPDMPSHLEHCYILTCNVSLEYEKSEVNAGFFYSSAEEREKMAAAERRFTDEKVMKIIELKRKVCTPESGKNFVVLNQKGIDPPSLDLLARENIMALRRVKRRNMERLTLCCGGEAVNSVENLSAADLGYAEHVYEQTLGEEKYTFVDGVKHPRSCCILIKGPNDHTIAQVKDAIRDGLRAVKNVFEDQAVVPGGGAFEVAAYSALQALKKEVAGKEKLGIEAFAQALLTIPKTLAENSGIDAQDAILLLLEEYDKRQQPVGVDLQTGQPFSPAVEGIWDNARVKRQMLSIVPTLAQQLLLVDEVLKAGKSMTSRGG